MHIFEIENTYPFAIQLLNVCIIEKWHLLTIYLLLNIVDTVTGLIKSKVNKSINSSKARIGVYKKLCNWIVIFISFTMSFCFIELGMIIDIDLTILNFLGWFVFASLMINEIGSIIENLVEAGCHVPKVLIKGLEVSEKALNDTYEDKK